MIFWIRASWLILIAIKAWVKGDTYTAVGRFGHSAVLVNDSLYFYGGDLSISLTADAQWLSDLAVLPVNIPFLLTDLPWQPASGPQSTVGGPEVYSHVSFVGGTNGGNMIIVGGVMPSSDKDTSDEAQIAYSYDCDVGRWNSFTLPAGNSLDRQGAAVAVTSNGVAYIWGGKRANPHNDASSRPSLPADMYRLDSLFPSNSSPVISANSPPPPLRYAHTQTMIGHTVVILGGFDGSTGDPISMADIWVFDTLGSEWSHITAQLDKDNKPANRSSHSQVLMPDGVSIIMYGGYDGYHVFNDVAVLDTRTWVWTVKNTNAAVQGRADHTATLVGTNMVVSFGFTGVASALTVLSDIEILDITTWSWTSAYSPSSSYATDGGKTNWIGQGQTTSVLPNTPSMAIVAGAVTGGLVVFVLIIVAFYVFNYHQHKSDATNGQERRGWPHRRHDHSSQRRRSHALNNMTEADEYKQKLFLENDHRGQHPPPPPPPLLHVKTDSKTPPRLPSPWTKQALFVRRAATSPSNIILNKPDEPSRPNQRVRRAATTATALSLSTSATVSTIVAGPSKPTSPTLDDADDADDDRFDRQEFILNYDDYLLINPQVESEKEEESTTNDSVERDASTPPSGTNTRPMPEEAAKKS